VGDVDKIRAYGLLDMALDIVMANMTLRRPGSWRLLSTDNRAFEEHHITALERRSLELPPDQPKVRYLYTKPGSWPTSYQ
jgi:hypothetical protein